MALGALTKLAKIVPELFGLFAEGVTNGAALLVRGVLAVDTIADLQSVPRRSDLRVTVKGYTATNRYGGGEFYWNAASLATHNGGTVIAVTGVATGRWLRSGSDSAIMVDWFGAEPGNVTSQRTAIEAADAVALATGAILCFRGHVPYYADELFIKSRVVLGNHTVLMKSATTNQGFFNWGNKPTGIVDGFVDGFNIDANGKDNVVNFRVYGNHTRSRVRNLILKDCDFYAFAIGGLTGQGDKDDVIDGLDLDGIYIASERGNVSLGTTYSFGLEIFPGVIAKNFRMRNINTYGKILNKVHSVDGLDIDHVNFKASASFNPLSSGYCEINNCKNVVIGPNAVFDSGNNGTYYALLIGGTRVVGGQDVTNFTMSGKIIGQLAIEKVVDVQMTSEFKCSHQTQIYNVCGRIGFNGGRLLSLNTPSGGTGSIEKIELTGVTMDGPVRFEFDTIPIAELIVTGGTFTLTSSQIRLNAVTYALFNGSTILLRGTSPLTYALSAKNTNVTLQGVMMDGGGTWNRSIYAIDATGSIRMIKCVLDRMVSSTILASGSSPLVLSLDNAVNGVAV